MDANYTNSYPFTGFEGKISCDSHSGFGCEMYLEPKNYIDEQRGGLRISFHSRIWI